MLSNLKSLEYITAFLNQICLCQQSFADVIYIQPALFTCQHSLWHEVRCKLQKPAYIIQFFPPQQKNADVNLHFILFHIGNPPFYDGKKMLT